MSRRETYDKDGLAERATVTRESGVPTFRVYRRPDFTTPALTREATSSETAALEVEERETIQANAWADFKVEASKLLPDVKILATLLVILLDDRERR